MSNAVNMFRAHKNRLSKEAKKQFNATWRNQDGLCLLTGKLLKKSKCIFGIYKTPNAESFEGSTEIPFLIGEEFIKVGKDESYKKVDSLMREIFKYEGAEEGLVEEPEMQEIYIEDLKQPEFVSIES